MHDEAWRVGALSGVAWLGVKLYVAKASDVAWRQIMRRGVKWRAVASSDVAWRQVVWRGVSRSNRMVHGIGITITKFRRSFYGRKAALCRHHGLRNSVSV